MMMRLVIGLAAGFAVGATSVAGVARAQTPPALGESAQRMIGNWEFSNADHDKICTATFKSDPAKVGYKVEFDANCVNLFPLVRDITTWKFPDNDLLYLLDAQGKSVVEFSEVEDGIFEAPTPGVGVLVSAECGGRRRAAEAAGTGRRRLGDRAQGRRAGLLADAGDDRGGRRLCRDGEARAAIRPWHGSTSRNGASTATN